jgi:multidrug efflux system membrane fusion protein
VVEVVRPRKRRWRWVLLVLVLLLAGFIYLRHAGSGGPKMVGAPQAVAVAKVVAGSMPITLEALGTVTPVATVTVLPQLSGYLTQVAFKEGDMVTQGQFLAQIDPRQYQINLELYQGQMMKDQAALGQAQADLARYARLGAQDSISAQQVTDQRFLVAQDQAAIQIDQANIDTAKLDLVYCHITAPVAGRVGLRLVDPGNYVTSGSTTGIVVITTVAPTTVVFSVAQNSLAPVLERTGQGATLPATAYSQDDTTQIETGTLTAVDNQVDTSTGMVKLRATFANADDALFPNEFVNIHLLVDTMTNVPLVPAQAVQTGLPGAYVYVVEPGNKVAVRKVTTGPTNGVTTVITAGLQPGDLVVTDGLDRLRDGARVSFAGAGPTSAPGSGSGWHHRHHRPADGSPPADGTYPPPTGGQTTPPPSGGQP